MAEVFLSYKREERPKIEALAKALEELGLNVWFDLELVPGDAFGKTINQQLTDAAAIVVCWSKGAIDSDWVQAEAHRAHARGVYVSARIEPCEPPVPFNAFQDADLSTWSSGSWAHEGLRALAVKLSRLVKRPIDQVLAKLVEEEAATIDAEIRDTTPQEDGERTAEVEQGAQDDQTAEAVYLLSHAASGTGAGSRDLSARLAQISFEEEILCDERTKWLVTNDESTAPRAAHATVLASLKDALRKASPNDIIALMPGTYRGRFQVDKSIRLVGFGSKDQRPVLVGIDDVAVLDLSENARVENLVVESRDTSAAVRITSGKPLVLRCLIDRQQLANSDRPCMHIAGNAFPTLIGTTIWSRLCPALYFAAGARCTAIASDVFANDADAIVIQARAKPVFERCEIKAERGHAVVAHSKASGRFEGCSLKALGATVIVNHDGAYSRFVGNSISVRNGSLIDLKAGARPIFERNRADPDPEAPALRALKEAELKKIAFKNPAIINRMIPEPVIAASYHKAQFAKNKLPDGSELRPPLH